MFAGAGNARSWKIKVFIGEFVGGTYGADWWPQPIPAEKFPKFHGLLLINVGIADSHKTFLSQCLREQVKPDPEKSRVSLVNLKVAHMVPTDNPNLYPSKNSQIFSGYLWLMCALLVAIKHFYLNVCGLRLSPILKRQDFHRWLCGGH